MSVYRALALLAILAAMPNSVLAQFGGMPGMGAPGMGFWGPAGRAAAGLPATARHA